MKTMKRVVAMALVLCMTLLAFPGDTLAYLTETVRGGVQTITGKNGEVITTDESWEETFPYGTFAFDKSEASLQEGGSEQRITIYRLGGTSGKATVTLQLAPALAQLEDDSYTDANAAGVSDYILQAEDDLPITAYQKFGKDAAALKPKTPVSVLADESQSTADTLDGAGEVTEYGTKMLYANVKADSYQWYLKNSVGTWQIIDGATEKSLPVSNEALGVSDFYCVYTKNGAAYGTDSYLGEVYAPRRKP